MKQFIIIISMLFWVSIQAQNNAASPPGGQKPPDTEASGVGGFSFAVISQGSATWGFDIFLGNQLFVHQPSVPGLPGNDGFNSREEATIAAIAMIGKLNDGDMPFAAMHSGLPDTWSQKSDVGVNMPNGATARHSSVGFSIGTKGYIGTGQDGASVKNDFWEYDPSTNAWTQKANFGGTARSGAVGFSIGAKGYIGTGAGGTSKKDFWEYDPALNTWTQKADFGGPARNLAIGFSIGTKGYLGTGTGLTSYNDFWEYDPSVNTWTQKAAFGGTARYGVAGFSIGAKGYIGTGYDGSYKTDFWEYDPSTNTWVQKAAFPGAPRYGAAGFSAGSRGFIGTGADASTNKGDFWEYDPGSNTWSAKAGFTGATRHKAVGFGIGTKGYFGTGANAGDFKSDFWELDPTANSWTRKTNFASLPRYMAVAFNIGTKGYVGPGGSPGGKETDVWEYDPTANTWTQKASFGGTARYGAVGFSIGTKGYLGTGYDGATKGDFWEFDPVANIWTQKSSFGGTARSSAVGFSIGNKGYLGTGWDGSNKSDFWEYDPAVNTWTQKAPFGGTARNGAVGFSVGSKGYIGTGTDGSYKNDFWEYDPATNAWTQKAPFGGVPRAYATGFGIGVKGYLGTGTDGSNKSDFWEYNPVTNAWTQKASFGGAARQQATGFGIGTHGYLGTGMDATMIISDFWDYSVSCDLPPAPVNTTPATNLTVCSGNSAMLSAGGTGILGWYSAPSGGTWLGGGSTFTTPVLTVATTFYVQDSTCGASATRTSVPVAVSTLPDPTLAGPVLVCQNSSGNVYTTEAAMNNYVWTITPGGLITGGGGVSDNTVTITWTTPGPQSVAVNYSNAGGCTAATPTLLIIDVTSLPGAAGEVNGLPAVCAGDLGVSYSTALIAGATGYAWTLPPDAVVAGGFNTNTILVDFGSASGTIAVAGTNSCGSGAPSPGFSVTVNPKPATPTVTANWYLLTSSAIDGNQWYHDGNSVPGATQQTYSVPVYAPGWYWTVVTIAGCISDTSNHQYILGEGIADGHATRITVYPVPNDGRFSIVLSHPAVECSRLEIFNDLGVRVYDEKALTIKDEEVIPVDLRPVKPGVYSVRLTSPSVSLVYKIVVADE